MENIIFTKLENCESVWGKKKSINITDIGQGKPGNQLTSSKDKNHISDAHYF